MFRRFFFSIISLSILFGTLNAKGQDRMIDEIVAVVGGNIILKSDIEEMYSYEQTSGQQVNEDTKCSILEDLMVNKLLVSEAELDTNIIVTDSQVLQSLDQQIDYYVQQLGSEGAVEQYFQQPMADIRTQLYDNIREQILSGQMQSKITGDVVTSPAEVRRYYRELPEDEIPMINPQVQYEEITIQPTIGLDQINEIKATLRDLKRRVEEGENFGNLAFMYSQDGSASNYGEVGYMARAEMDPAYATAAFNLKDDKVSNVVESQFGFHIIQLIGKRDNKVDTRHILLIARPSEEALETAKSRLDSITEIIRKGNLSFENAAMYFSDEEDTRNGGGLAINPNTLSSKWRLDELDPDVSKVLDDLNINEISDPFLTVDPKTNKTVYKIVKLIDRIDEHPANLQEDYKVINDQYLNIKQTEIMNDWIKERLAKTYVHIDDSYLNCNFTYDGWIKNE